MLAHNPPLAQRLVFVGKEGFQPNLVLADFFVPLLIIAHYYVYNDIQGGVELSSLRNL